MSLKSNIESNILELSNTNQIKYEYSPASNSIRILNGVEICCRDVASFRGHEHKPIRYQFCGGGHKGKYSSSICLYSCKFSNFESNSGKRFVYSKCQIRIKFHPILTVHSIKQQLKTVTYTVFSVDFLKFYTSMHKNDINTCNKPV